MATYDEQLKDPLARTSDVLSQTGTALSGAQVGDPKLAGINTSLEGIKTTLSSLSSEQGATELSNLQKTENSLLPQGGVLTQGDKDFILQGGTITDPSKLQAYQDFVRSNSAGSKTSLADQYDLDAMTPDERTALAKEQSDLDAAQSEVTMYTDKLKNFDVSNDPALKAIQEGIEKTWTARIAEMQRINKSREASIKTTGVRIGSQFTGGAGGMMGGIISEEERQGVERISGLEAQKMQALAAAREAFENKKWNQYSKLVSLANENYEKQLKEVEKLNVAMAEKNKQIQAQASAVEEATQRAARDSAITELYSQGLTNPAQLLGVLNFDEKGNMTGNFTFDEVQKITKSMQDLDKIFPGITGELQGAIKAGLVPKETTLEEFAFIKDPTKALDMQEQRLRMAKLQKDMQDHPGAMINSENKLVLNSKEGRTINKEITGSDAYKSIRKGQDSLQYLLAFEKTFKEVGTTSGVTSPFDNANLKAKYNASILNLKEFFNLGVLNGPDETILRGVLPDPTSQGFVTNISAKQATKSGIQNLKTQIENTIDDRYESLASQYGDYSAETLPALRDLNRLYIEQKTLLNPQIATLIQENLNLSHEDIIAIIK